jgi:hypothetical protein
MSSTAGATSERNGYCNDDCEEPDDREDSGRRQSGSIRGDRGREGLSGAGEGDRCCFAAYENATPEREVRGPRPVRNLGCKRDRDGLDLPDTEGDAERCRQWGSGKSAGSVGQLQSPTHVDGTATGVPDACHHDLSAGRRPLGSQRSDAEVRGRGASRPDGHVEADSHPADLDDAAAGDRRGRGLSPDRCVLLSTGRVPRDGNGHVALQPAAHGNVRALRHHCRPGGQVVGSASGGPHERPAGDRCRSRIQHDVKHGSGRVGNADPPVDSRSGSNALDDVDAIAWIGPGGAGSIEQLDPDAAGSGAGGRRRSRARSRGGDARSRTGGDGDRERESRGDRDQMTEWVMVAE